MGGGNGPITPFATVLYLAWRSSMRILYSWPTDDRLRFVTTQQ